MDSPPLFGHRKCKHGYQPGFARNEEVETMTPSQNNSTSAHDYDATQCLQSVVGSNTAIQDIVSWHESGMTSSLCSPTSSIRAWIMACHVVEDSPLQSCHLLPTSHHLLSCPILARLSSSGIITFLRSSSVKGESCICTDMYA